MKPTWAPPSSDDPSARFGWGGYVIASNFNMPRLQPAIGAPDLVVRWVESFERAPLPTTTAHELRWPDGCTAMLETGSDGRRATLAIDEVGTFSIDATAALIEFVARPDADPMRVEHFLVNTMLGIYAGMRGEVSLHAAAASTNGRVTIFAGPSGSGKSTALFQALEKGALLVADDATVLRRIDDEWFAWPGATTMRLQGMSTTHGWGNRGKTEIPFASTTGRLPVERLVLVGARHEDLQGSARQYVSMLLQQSGFALSSSPTRDKLSSLIRQLVTEVPVEARPFV